MKISKKYYGFVLGTIISFIMSVIMSFVITVANLGFVDDFFLKWGQAFIIGFVIAFPIALAVVPIARKISDKITQ
jgi:hypothetical protein